jgi:hypothetical protein
MIEQEKDKPVAIYHEAVCFTRAEQVSTPSSPPIHKRIPSKSQAAKASQKGEANVLGWPSQIERVLPVRDCS